MALLYAISYNLYCFSTDREVDQTIEQSRSCHMAAPVPNETQNAEPSVGGTNAQSHRSSASHNAKKPRQKRPNYNLIHSKPLPVEVHPLPAFIPHNPISIVRIAITLLSHSFWRPNSHPVVHKAYFSEETQSIHVTDPASIRALWEQGFWGTGSLSRSEPRWLDQEKRKRGIEVAATSEEITRGRREERRQMKLERAKAQREAIEQQLREEGKLDAATNLDELVENGGVTESPKGTLYPADTSVPIGHVPSVEPVSVIEAVSEVIDEQSVPFHTAIEDQEHLQLTFEESFFLSYVLGVLEVFEDNASQQPSSLLRLFCAHSEFPRTQDLSGTLPSESHVGWIEPDNPFLLQYVVFHHFRSLGWVVRSGIKFACDYLLYLRGPAFHHAEFAVMIIPAYTDSYWSENAERAAACKKKEQRDWWRLHRLNRVQTQVHKTLLLVYVEVSPPWDKRTKGEEIDIGDVLKTYSVREFIWRRWSPNRNRD